MRVLSLLLPHLGYGVRSALLFAATVQSHHQWLGVVEGAVVLFVVDLRLLLLVEAGELHRGEIEVAGVAEVDGEDGEEGVRVRRRSLSVGHCSPSHFVLLATSGN